MGIVATRDTRRISFDNTFVLSNTALAVAKTLKDEDIIGFDGLTPETAGDIIYADKPKIIEEPEEGESDYWVQRTENLKKEHQIINKIIEAEYNKHYAIINNTYEPPKVTHEKILKIKPCFDWRAKIMKCYQDNPHQPLVCSAYVQAFSQSAAKCRAAEE